MIEFFAAHKIAVAGLVLAAAVFVLLRHKAPAAAAGVPVDPYSSTPPSSQVGAGGLSLPVPSPPFGEAGGVPPGSSPGDQSSTGPGAGPAVVQATAPPPTDTTLQFPDPSSPGAPGTPQYIAATTGQAAVDVPDGSGGTTTLVGIDARMAHPSPDKVTAAQVAATAASEDYAHRFVEASQGFHTAGL